jgi:Tfp pilus assembly protein PilV
MSKIILTAAIVVSVGILSLIKTNTTTISEKTTSLQIEKASVNSRVAVLATAD